MRTALLVLFVALLAWSALGLAGVVPAPWDLVERRAPEATSGGELSGVGPDGPGATLAGRGGRRPERGTPDEATSVPPEVRGSVPRGGALRGRVVRTAGRQPVEGARVRLSRPSAVAAYLGAASEGRWDVLEARTDREGRFSFLDVRPAKGYVVRAFAGGGGVISSPKHDVAERQRVDLGDLVLEPMGGLHGRVLDAQGQGLAGARVAVTWVVDSILGMVLAEPDTLPEREAETTTAADGRFRFEGLEPGKKTVVVATAGHGGRVLVGVQVAAGAVQQLPDVTLGAQGVVAGRVLWDDGRPAVGARVFAGEPKPGKPTLSTAVAGADGAFRIEHLDGQVARLGVFVPGIPVELTDSVALGTLDVELTLRSAGSLVGRVVEKQSGNPVARFGVRLEPADDEDWMSRAVRLLIDGSLGPQGFQAPDGRFRVGVVAHGRWRVVVSAQGFPEVRSEPVEIRPGAETDVGVLALAQGHRLSGSVRGTEGEPLANAGVRLFSTRSVGNVSEDPDEVVNWSSYDDAEDALTDSDGRFELPPQTPGAYALHVRCAFRQPALLAHVDLTSGDVTGLEVRLLPAARVVLQALEADGRPAVGELLALVTRQGWATWGAADEHGQVELSGVPPGPALVRWAGLATRSLLRATMHVPAGAQRDAAYERLLAAGAGEEQLRGGETSTFTLRVPARVAVTFRVPPSAQGSAASALLVHQEAAMFGRWCQPAEDGTFRALLEPATYDLGVQYAGDDDMSLSDLVPVVIPDVPTHLVDLR